MRTEDDSVSTTLGHWMASCGGRSPLGGGDTERIWDLGCASCYTISLSPHRGLAGRVQEAAPVGMVGTLGHPLHITFPHPSPLPILSLSDPCASLISSSVPGSPGDLEHNDLPTLLKAVNNFHQSKLCMETQNMEDVSR